LIIVFILMGTLSTGVASCSDNSTTPTTSTPSKIELQRYFSEVRPMVERHEQMMSMVVDTHTEALKLISEPSPMRALSNMTSEEIVKSLNRSNTPNRMTNEITKYLFQLSSDAADFAVLSPPNEARAYHSLIERSLIKSKAALESWLNFWNLVKKSNKRDAAILEQANRHYQDAVEFRLQASKEMGNVMETLK
ncbi:MAG: hypothetical protein KKF26_06120, partial [Chloroflexi bacterium]|nr:hypothetical protein [Chloroflexota bacterium]